MGTLSTLPACARDLVARVDGLIWEVLYSLLVTMGIYLDNSRCRRLFGAEAWPLVEGLKVPSPQTRITVSLHKASNSRATFLAACNSLPCALRRFRRGAVILILLTIVTLVVNTAAACSR